MTPFLLSTEGLSKNFGGVQAAVNFDLGIHDGELVGLIGPNGAGKSTIFNLITGFQTPSSGFVYLKGELITGKTPASIAKRGVARTFQHSRLLREMSVLDNIMVAFHLASDAGFWNIILHDRRFKQSERMILENTLELLRLFKMEDRLSLPASSLPYGDQRFLEIVRALALKPKVLLLDEPTAGMNSNERDKLVDLILHINREYNVAILLIEHHMEMVMNICQRIVVLNFGSKLAEGTPYEIQRNPQVIEAYLGVEEDAQS